MICSIVKRIVSLATQDILSNAYKAFYNLEILSLMVSDLWHIDKHTCKYCVLSSEECIFHPSLSNFESIMKNPDNNKNLNLSIAEQKWTTWNKAKFMKLLSKQKFRLHCLVYRKYHNTKLKQTLIAQGYKFVSIETIQKRRTFLPNGNVSDILSMKNIIKTQSKHRKSNAASNQENVSIENAQSENVNQDVSEPPKKRVRLSSN